MKNTRMAKTRQVVKQEIKDFIDKQGKNYSDWYVGIAADPKDRLFNGHGVDKENGTWIHRECMSCDGAREVEDYFLNTIGTNGGPGGGDDDTCHVYAYVITSRTRE